MACHFRIVPKNLTLWKGSGITPGSYGAANFLNAVAGIELFLIGTSIDFPVRLSVTFSSGTHSEGRAG